MYKSIQTKAIIIGLLGLMIWGIPTGHAGNPHVPTRFTPPTTPPTVPPVVTPPTNPTNPPRHWTINPSPTRPSHPGYPSPGYLGPMCGYFNNQFPQFPGNQGYPMMPFPQFPGSQCGGGGGCSSRCGGGGGGCFPGFNPGLGVQGNLGFNMGMPGMFPGGGIVAGGPHMGFPGMGIGGGAGINAGYNYNRFNVGPNSATNSYINANIGVGAGGGGGLAGALLGGAFMGGGYGEMAGTAAIVLGTGSILRGMASDVIPVAFPRQEPISFPLYYQSGPRVPYELPRGTHPLPGIASGFPGPNGSVDGQNGFGGPSPAGIGAPPAF